MARILNASRSIKRIAMLRLIRAYGLWRSEWLKLKLKHGDRGRYALHLLERGTDLRYMQELPGHKSSKTTEIYTHVSTKSIQKKKSPFGDL